MRILFVDNTKGHNPKERTSRPTGGILNSLTLIPKYLASKGHEVYVTSSYNKSELIDGVRYIQQNEKIPKWDVTVFNRDVLPKNFLLYAKEQGSKIVWWLHDIVQTSYLKDDAFMYCDSIVALSDYCRKTYSEFYSIDPNKFEIIPNGVDTELFYEGDYEQRDPKLFITASALVKGYLPLQAVYENLKRKDSDVDFRIYSSQTLHGLQNTPQHIQFLNFMGEVGAHIYAPVSPEVLAHLMRKAWCLMMPNSYPEICSNLLLQARASGCPVVTSNIGSAPEFITNEISGLMTTHYYPHDSYSWIVEYTNLVLELRDNKKLHEVISRHSADGVLNWDQIGEKWNELLTKLNK